MNSAFVSLSSTETSGVTTVPSLSFSDHTLLNVSLSGVVETFLPLSLAIDWGDGKTEFWDNDILVGNNVITNIFSSIFQTVYTHEYFPSPVAPTSNFTAGMAVQYTTGDTLTFQIPIAVTNYSWGDSVGDAYLVNTLILPETGNKNHQFITQKGGYLVEVRTPTS